MRSDVFRFAGEINPPELFISPLVDRDIGTLTGKEAGVYGVRDAFWSLISPELTESDQISFADTEKMYPPDMSLLVDRYEDATNGIHPGHPTVRYREIDLNATPEEIMELPMDTVQKQLERFYKATGLRPRPALQPKSPSEPKTTWGGDANKLLALIRLPENPFMRSHLHELGHCCMNLVGFTRTTSTTVDELEWSMNTTWNLCTSGLTYITAEGEMKGTVLEEAVADGLGALVNRKLGLVKTLYNDEVQKLPEMVAPHLIEGGHSGSAPSAVALELIAKELGIPAERYLKMFVDYANAGIHNTDARQEVAETVYKGTRGRLMLHQIEELPYPINRNAGLALLWAVEDSLDIPDHQRYSDLFFSFSPGAIQDSSVVVGNANSKS